MEEKKSTKQKELCAITKEFARKKLEEIINTPEKKAVLDEYFTWVNALNSSVDVINESDTSDETLVEEVK